MRLSMAQYSATATLTAGRSGPSPAKPAAPSPTRHGQFGHPSGSDFGRPNESVSGDTLIGADDSNRPKPAAPEGGLADDIPAVVFRMRRATERQELKDRCRGDPHFFAPADMAASPLATSAANFGSSLGNFSFRVTQTLAYWRSAADLVAICLSNTSSILSGVAP